MLREANKQVIRLSVNSHFITKVKNKCVFLQKLLQQRRTDVTSSFPPLTLSKQHTPPHSGKLPAVTNILIFKLYKNDITLVRSCWRSFHKKHNCILLQKNIGQLDSFYREHEDSIKSSNTCTLKMAG